MTARNTLDMPDFLLCMIKAFIFTMVIKSERQKELTRLGAIELPFENRKAIGIWENTGRWRVPKFIGRTKEVAVHFPIDQELSIVPSLSLSLSLSLPPSCRIDSLNF